MKQLVITGAVVVGLSAATVFAQPPGRGPGMGGMHYDKATETTLTGTVEEVRMHQGQGGGTGTHLLFTTDDGARLDVHLGPTNWLTDKKYVFATGDRLAITGSKVKFNDADALIAREITKGDVKMVLRNENGVPLWSGAMRNTPPR